jgi:hypothetical protein
VTSAARWLLAQLKRPRLLPAVSSHAGNGTCLGSCKKSKPRCGYLHLFDGCSHSISHLRGWCCSSSSCYPLSHSINAIVGWRLAAGWCCCQRLQDTQCVQVICRNTQSHTHAHTFIPRCAAASARHSRCSKLLKAQLAQCCGNARTTCWLSGAVDSQPCMHVHALLQLDATLAAHSSPSSTA